MLRGPTKHLFRPRCSSSFGTTLETDEQLLVAAARLAGALALLALLEYQLLLKLQMQAPHSRST